MSEDEGTYAKLVQLAQQKSDRAKRPTPTPTKAAQPPARAEETPAADQQEGLSTTPYISQNYRFTDDELRWLRRQAYNLSERLGGKVSQNTILRVALHHLREACTRNPKANPLIEVLSRLLK